MSEMDRMTDAACEIEHGRDVDEAAEHYGLDTDKLLAWMEDMDDFGDDADI